MKNISTFILTLTLFAASTACRSAKSVESTTKTDSDSISLRVSHTLINRLDSLIRTEQFFITLDSVSLTTKNANLTARSAHISGKSTTATTSTTRIVEADTTIRHKSKQIVAQTKQTATRQPYAPVFPLWCKLAIAIIVIIILIKRRKK